MVQVSGGQCPDIPWAQNGRYMCRGGGGMALQRNIWDDMGQVRSIIWEAKELLYQKGSGRFIRREGVGDIRISWAGTLNLYDQMKICRRYIRWAVIKR